MAPKDSLVPFPDGWSMPFFYASLKCCWIFYEVDADILRPYLDGTSLEPWIVNGKGSVSSNLQFYTDHNGPNMAVCNEVEFNINAYPKAYEADVPDISLRQFVIGNDQTKLIGGFRVYVPCDNKFAIKAGAQVFGEQKFFAKFAYNVPAANNHALRGDMEPHRTWDYYCMDETCPDQFGVDPAPPHDQTIFGVHVDTSRGTPQPANHSPMTLYAMVEDDVEDRTVKHVDPATGEEFLNGRTNSDRGNAGRLTASRWNMLGTYQSWFLDESPDVKVETTIGGSDHDMCKDMGKILADAKPAAVLVFQSPPAAIENRAWYVNPDRS